MINDDKIAFTISFSHIYNKMVIGDVSTLYVVLRAIVIMFDLQFYRYKNNKFYR